MDSTEAHPTQFPAQLKDHQHDDEPPAVKGKVQQFYLVKLHPYEDPELESRIKDAHGVIRQMYEDRAPVVEEFEFTKMDHDKVRWEMKWHRHLRGGGQCSWVNYKKRDLEHLQQSFLKLSCPSSEWEKQVRKLKRRLIHESPSKAKERDICKNLTQLVRTRELVDRAEEEEKAEIMERWGSKDEIENRIQWLKIDLKAEAKMKLETVKKEKKMKMEDEKEFTYLQQQKASIERDLLTFKGKLVDLNKKKAMAHKCILDSYKLQDKLKADYDEYVATSTTAKELAMKKDLLGLQELINQANERFMCRWKNEKGVREGYKKRVASSLGSRGLSLDGRLGDPDEDEA